MYASLGRPLDYTNNTKLVLISEKVMFDDFIENHESLVTLL